MKRSLKNNILFFVISVILIPGCRKDSPVPDDPISDPQDTTSIDSSICGSECEDFPQSPELGWFYQSSGPQYKAPCFNPNNSNEFVFLRTGTAPVAELVKYDLVSGVETVLSDSLQIAYPPKWSRTGWITFATLQNKVWKIKSDGTQLTQLTFGPYDRSPVFDYSGNRIIYYRDRSYSNAELSANPDLYKEYKMIVIDLSGNVIDSVMAENVMPGNYFQKWGLADFNLQEEVYFKGGSGIYSGIYKMNTSLDMIFKPAIVSLYPNNGSVYGFDQAQGFLYYSKYRNGLYRTEIQTGEEIKIRNGCDTRTYYALSVSEDDSKILAEVVISTVLNDYDIDEQREIWLIDPHTCDEEKVLGE